MKKAELQQINNDNIRLNPGIIDEENHGDINDAMIEESYPEIVSDSNVLQTVTEQINDSVDYICNFSKQGRHSRIQGQFRVFQPSSPDFVLKIKPNEYIPKLYTDNVQSVLAFNTTGENVRIGFVKDLFNNVNLFCFDNILNNGWYSFNFVYDVAE